MESTLFSRARRKLILSQKRNRNVPTKFTNSSLKGSPSDVSVTRRMLLNKKRNVSDGVSSPLSCGDALQGEVSIERDSISWNVLSHTTIHETQSLHSGNNDETFVRRTRRRQYNPKAENTNSLVNILGRTIVNEDGSVTTNITEQQLPLLEGSILSAAAEGILRILLY